MKFLKFLDWDSNHLKIQAGTIDIRNLGAPDLSNIKTEIFDSNFAFISVKCPKNEKNLRFFSEMNCQLMDTEQTFKFDKPVNKNIPMNVSIDFSPTIQSDEFEDLAVEMKHSRFFKDSRISNEIALKMWKSSLKNHCLGRAHELALLKVDGHKAGLIVVTQNNFDDLYFHIVGLLKKWQGQGLGTTFVSSAASHYGKDRNLYVETQKTNISAQKLYSKTGFKLFREDYVFHWWKPN